MKIEYIRNLNGSYMIIKDAEYLYENAELLMLLNNRIPGLLNLQVIISDGKMEYWYEITGATSFRTLLDAAPLSGTKLRCLIEDIFDMNRQLEDYLLDGENIIYLPEMVYFDRTAEKYRFCYLPGSKVAGENSLRTLTEHLLTRIDHKDANAVSMGYSLYEKSMQECCSVRELMSCIVLPKEKNEECDLNNMDNQRHSGETAGEQAAEKEDDRKDTFLRKKHAAGKTAVGKTAAGNTVSGNSDAEKKNTNPKRMGKKLFPGFRTQKRTEKTGIKTTPDYAEQLREIKVREVVAEPIRSDSPTMFLNIENQIEIGKLIYQGEGREDNFLLEEDVFLIGKDAEMVNGVLRADTVSRIHARIFQQEGHYYIEDLNSTNGTFLNGKEVFYRQPVKLEKQDRISFATEEYLFS